MGTLIDICGAVGLSETLVRTAVSRLVAAGRLAEFQAGFHAARAEGDIPPL